MTVYSRPGTSTGLMASPGLGAMAERMRSKKPADGAGAGEKVFVVGPLSVHTSA